MIKRQMGANQRFIGDIRCMQNRTAPSFVSDNLLFYTCRTGLSVLGKSFSKDLPKTARNRMNLPSKTERYC
jgi:hypothetical protein